MQNEIKKMKNEDKLIVNEKYLSIDHIPENIFYRDQIFKELFQYFRTILIQSPNYNLLQQIIIVIGNPGTGKTTIINKFGMELEKLVQSQFESKIFEFRIINCRRNRTVYSVLVSLMKSFIPEFPNRGFSSSEILRMIQDMLGQTQTCILLVLDEINYLEHEPEFQDFLYSITRLNDEYLLSPNQNISLILISQNDFFLRNIDESTKSSLSKNIIYFEPYSQDEIYGILLERSIKSLKQGSFTEAQIKDISRNKNINGDARYAIELLWRILKSNGTNSKLITSSNFINSIIKDVYPFNKQKLVDLTFQQKLFLKSVANTFYHYPDLQYATLNQIKNEFQFQIHEYDVNVGTGNTSLWNHLNALKKLNLLNTEVVSKNYRGRFTKIYLKAPKNLLLNELGRLINNELKNL